MRHYNPLVKRIYKTLAKYFQTCIMRDMDTSINAYAQTPPWLINRNKRIFELREEGKKFREIAELYGITHQRARQIWERECRTRKIAA